VSGDPRERYRVIGAVGATGIIVASMVGSGIFSLTGKFGASVATPGNLLAAWAVGGVLALCGGLSLAELGAMIPCSGGSIEFARRAFGGLVGYLVAMVTILSGYLLAIAVVALFLAEFVDALFEPDLSDHAIAAAVIVAAFASQLPGLRAGYAFNTALSIVKIGFVAAFAVAGLLVTPALPRLEAAAPADAADPGLFSPAVAGATLSVSFAYLGWSTGADVAGDIRNPGRNVPRAILAAIGIVFLLYIGVNLAYLRAVHPLAMTEPDGAPMKAIGSVAARILFGDAVGRAMTAVIAVLLFSTIVSGMITAARILESMAHAGEIPAWTGVRRANGVPLRGLVVTLVASLAALSIGSLGQILDMLNVLVAVFSSLSVAAVLVLRRTMPDAPRPFRVPLFPATPIIYLALAAWSVVVGAIEGGVRAIVASAIAVGALLLIRPLLVRPRATKPPMEPTP
jgi:APA family basic amino acid/polyamine antiporter